tara:strand:+ start:536 stop:1156 length:621 start_codon:yes stop_codon:yes gene_type:complete
MALVKYNNNSLSSVTTAAGFPAGAMTLIKTLTASSSSTLSFVHGSSDVVLDSTYPIYVFKFINIHPATDNTKLTFNGSADSGSNYNVTKTTTAFYSYQAENAGGQGVGYYASEDLAQSTSFQPLLIASGNANDECASGYLHLFNPSSTTFVKHFISRGNAYSGDYTQEVYIGGYMNTTSAVDAVQFKMTSGNIDSGTIKLYGIKDS